MVLVEINTPFLEKQKVTFKLLLGTELERMAKKLQRRKMELVLYSTVKNNFCLLAFK